MTCRVGSQHVQSAEQLPHGRGAAGDVLAVVACVVPAAGDVEGPGASPARIEPFGIRTIPGSDRGVAAIRRYAGVSGRAGVAGWHLVTERGAGPQQPEESQRVSRQPCVHGVIDSERVAHLVLDLHPQTTTSHAGIGEVQHVHRVSGGGVRPNRPRHRQPRPHRLAARCPQPEGQRMTSIVEVRRPHGPSRQVADLIDAHRRPVRQHIPDRPPRIVHPAKILGGPLPDGAESP